MDLQKLSPFNWFKKEEAEQPLSSRSLSPFQSMLSIHKELDDFFNNSFRSGDMSFGKDLQEQLSSLNKGMLRPKVDISETSELYHIDVEVPGVEEKDLTLNLESDGTLTISGKKSLETKSQDKEWHRVERSYGSFQRVLSLPKDADQERVSAKFKNGVLSIDVARRALSNDSSIRKIDIRSE